jgi:hypothetical protein
LASIFIRQPLLDKKTEDRLMHDIAGLWNDRNPDTGRRFTGTEIARILEFGVEGTPYEKLKPSHVYHFRQKHAGREPWKSSGELKRHSYHYKGGKKIEEPTTLAEFREKLDNFPPFKRNNAFKMARARAYIILLYWSGLRKSEIYDLPTQAFVPLDDGLRLLAVRYKKRVREVVELKLLDKMWGIPEVKIFLARFEENQRPFDISPTTAWHYVKLMDNKLYPHYFRLNLVSTFANDPEMSIAKLRSWFAFNLSTINSYLGKSKRLQEGMAESLVADAE